MFSWIFKKPGVPAAPAKSATIPRPLANAPAAAPAARPPRPRPGEGEDWERRLRDTQGDEALLQLAQAAGAPLQTKLDAIGALAGEDALKRAERAFRSHDRKVHRLAKQRLETAVTQRQSRSSAQALQSQAEAFLDEAQLPLNRLVELDRAWEALPQALLAPGQAEQFSALRARLATQVRERSDAEQLAGQRAHQEALAQAAAAAAAAQAAALAAAPPAPAEVETAASPAAESPQRAARPAAIDDAQRQRLGQALGAAESALAEGQVGELRKHLKAIDGLLAAFGAARVPGALRQRWQALRAEGGRLQGWQQWGGTRARDDLAAEAEALARLAEQARPDAAPQPVPGVPDEVPPLGGDGSAETPPALPPEAVAAAAAVPQPATRASRMAPRLNVKAHAGSIQALRQRWKELDRLGAAAPAALWQRFDTALKTAYEPVAAQVAVQKAARQENLLAREALLTDFEALPVAAAVVEGNPGVAEGRELALALDRFQQAWRRLGPIEHTAPAAAREVLQQRLEAAVGRVERPLQAARAAAVARREALIAQAQALAQAGAPALGREVGPEARDVATQGPEAGRQLRDLQARWQEQARQMPLPRGLENALWTRFKAATDAVLAQREAIFAAREAELAANLAACEALLTRLEALGAQTPVVELERALADADAGWRQGGPLPRGALARVEARYASARQAALDRVAAARREQWQSQCDALAAVLATGDARADMAASAPRGEEGRQDMTVQTQAAALLPAWARALAQRQDRAAPGPLAAEAVDDLLLQLESALGMPAAPERHAQMRQLKLRALKQALEGRSPEALSALPSAANPGDWLLAALRQSGSAPAQQQRLRAIVAALRLAPAGALALARPGP